MSIVRIFLIILSFLPFFVSASQQCTIASETDFDFTVEVSAADLENTVEISATNPNANDYPLNNGNPIWSNKSSSNAAITDTKLKDNTNYTLGFSFRFSSNSGQQATDGYFTYSRKAEGQDWEEVTTDKFIRISRTTDFTTTHGELSCDETTTGATPEPLPDDFDVCDYVPGTMQTNYYPAGAPYGSLFVSGSGTTITLPDDDFVMSFLSNQSTVPACLYPSSTTAESCKIDQTPVDGYPLVLTDNFTGEDLIIPQDSTYTLESGEYWFDNLTFGGNNSKLAISGTVVLHYKNFNIPQTGNGTTIYLNEGGNSKDLFIIGHGTTSSILTDQNSAILHAVAHFYVDPATTDFGISLAGSETYINGGLSANNIGLSGANIDIDGTDACGDETAPVEPDFDVCDYFPSSVQGNMYSDAGQISSPLVVSNGNSGLGNRLYLDDETPLAFASSTTSVTESNVGTPGSGCVYSDGGTFSNDPHAAEECIINTGMDPFSGAAPQAEAFTPSGSAISIADGTSTTIEPGEYTELNLGQNGSSAILSAGEYWIGTINLTKNDSKMYTAGDGQVIVHYNQINFADRVYINASSDRNNNSSKTPDQIDTSSYSPENLVLIGHGANSGVVPSNNDIYINAMWYISPLSSSGFNVDGAQRFQLIGSLSAPKVSLTNGSDYSYVYGTNSGSCDSTTVPDADYILDVTPDYQFALLCEAPEVVYTVYNDDGTIATDYDGTITASYPEGLTPLDPTVGSKNSDYVYTPNNGEVKVPVETDTLGEYTVQAALTDDTDTYDSGNVLFGPYKFDIESVKAVAAHPTSFSVKVLACKNDEITTVKGYEGDKDLEISEIELTKPTVSEGARDGSLKLSDSEDGSYSSSNVTLAFSDTATASGYLTYQEAGSLNFTLTDPEFECPEEYDGCEITNEDDTTENITTLEGVANVDVRPWTFAICDPSSRDMSGTSQGGSAFIAAGDAFELEVRPIVWQSGGSIADGAQIDVSNFCNASVTENFFIEEAPTATVEVGSELASPENGRLGTGIESSNLLTREHYTGTDNQYFFDELKWQEVGSLKVTADTLADYLDMDINLGYRNVGRFYPHHLSHRSNDWNYESGHSGFAYMNQPISMDYIVEARSEADSVTWNYGLFNSALQDELALTAINSENNQSLLGRLYAPNNSSSNGWSSELTDGAVSERNGQFQVYHDEFEFLKKVSSNPNTSDYTSTPDGPYDSSNARFGVAVTQKIDDVDFDFDEVDSDEEIDLDANGDGASEKGVSFIEQPDFRYGRMALDSVSGSTGELVKVSLRAEYWDGDSYVQNQDDNGSQFMTSQHCVLSNIANSDAYLTDTNGGENRQTVDDGSSDIVLAGQVTSQREIARIFLRQGETQPNGVDCDWSAGDQRWLQFNWRDYGDEDPSTVVVFGAYRGNDRVIYRGEPNLVGN